MTARISAKRKTDTRKQETRKQETSKQETSRAKKLRLNKETLRDLTDHRGAVKGGVKGGDCSREVSGCW